MRRSRALTAVFIYLFFFGYLLAACRREPNLVPTNPSQPDTSQTTDTTGPSPSDTTLQPHDTTVQPIDTTSFTVDNTWECDIDGVHYSGTVDTTFIQLTNAREMHADTMITCTGTSDDKTANIEFGLRLNRHPQYIGDYTGFEGFVVFDTLSGGYFTSAGARLRDRMRFEMDTLTSNTLKASFSGALGSFNNLTNGRFSCTFGKGRNEPKFFSFLSNEGDVAGVFRNARLTSNSLILEGMPFSNAEQRFKLIVRTGGTIKPGKYEGKNGDVYMSFYSPSLYRFYITDTPGHTTVLINSVSGNEVRGTFSAVDNRGRAIRQGTFSCRVKNYIPEPDLSDRWQFTTDDGPQGIFGFRAFGGNVRTAALTQEGSKYLLTINGESDHGASSFKIQLYAHAPIDTGIYKTDYMPAYDGLDELYFKSPVKLWNGNDTYLYAGNGYTHTTYCSITAIDAHHVEGIFYGAVTSFLNVGAHSTTSIQYGKFRASF